MERSSCERSVRRSGFRVLIGFGVLLGLTACFAQPRPAGQPSPQAVVTGANDSEALLKDLCLGCHVGKTLKRFQKSPGQWQRTIGRMRVLGVNISDAEAEQLSDYLSVATGPEEP